MVAIYHFMKAIGLAQTLLALILVYSGGAALNYYIAKGFFDTIPKSLDEAARMSITLRSVRELCSFPFLSYVFLSDFRNTMLPE